MVSFAAETAQLAAGSCGAGADRPIGLRPPLWCFAGGGSPALALLPIARELPADQSVHALQAHGFEGMAWPDWTVAGAARRHLREIQQKAPAGPYPLLGHSFGGLVALEVARRLTDQGHRVPFVMLLDTLLPRSIADPSSPRARGRDVATGVSPPPWRRRWQMHRRVAGAGLIGYPAAVRDEVFWERSLRMANRYRPQPWAGRMVLVVAEHNRDDLDRWATVATGQLDVIRVPGGHSSILRSPFNAPVVQRLREELDAARGGVPRPGTPVVSPSLVLQSFSP